MSTIYDVLRRPLVTEKSSYQSGKLNQYSFVVADNATRKNALHRAAAITQLEELHVLALPRVVGPPAKADLPTDELSQVTHLGAWLQRAFGH